MPVETKLRPNLAASPGSTQAQTPKELKRHGAGRKAWLLDVLRLGLLKFFGFRCCLSSLGFVIGRGSLRCTWMS